MTIPIYIGSSDRFADVEWLPEYSIRRNTQADVEIHIVRPNWYGMAESGCTGFSKVRHAVPEIARNMGHLHCIYLDVDMLVLGDISELWDYRANGRWVCLLDGTTEVSVIDTRSHAARYPRIPPAWNAEDQVFDGMKLLHFTDLSTQPWIADHPNRDAVEIYERYHSWYRTECNQICDSVTE